MQKEPPTGTQGGGHVPGDSNGLGRRSFLGSLASAAAISCGQSSARAPNVVIVITDDQGYGDLACHGNPQLRTPNLDRFHNESVRFTNFHVDPLCAPTRAGLLTGRYAYRTGVTAAYAGRSILRRDEVTLANMLSDAGYRTGLFGKWHLGDNWPYRPNERGFDETVACWSGGVTQAADWWGNDYFDDTYYRNNVPEKFTGYCTDVFFDEGLRFIEQHRDQPFFLFLPTNTPHAPYWVDDRYREPYLRMGVEEPRASFYGMIENIDENFGRLRTKLSELGIEDNTILVFMTDNGSSAGWREGFNAGMRNGKGSNYDGGHRVPLFVRWPEGGIDGGRDVGSLAAHIDLVPTLLELTGIAEPDIAFDGVSLTPQLTGRGDSPADRTHFIQHQQVRREGEFQMESPRPFYHSAVLTNRWRLVNGRELYDMSVDPSQEDDVAGDHPEVVASLRSRYEAWWDDVTARFDEYLEIPVGAEEANPVRLTSFDWYTGGPPNQRVMQEAPTEGPWVDGYWAIEVIRSGRYRITLREHPPEANHPIDGDVAVLLVGDQELSLRIAGNATSVEFEVDLAKGKTTMSARFIRDGGSHRGAYFAYFELLASAAQRAAGSNVAIREPFRLHIARDPGPSSRWPESTAFRGIRR